MNIYERNVKVFLENRQLSIGAYKGLTDKMIANTKVYKTPLKCKVPERQGKCCVRFFETDTVSTILYLTRNGHNVCALNFADALTAGGLVFQGELTQEEDLCRCSNLYESLVKDECTTDYYGYNRTKDTFYSDRIIYTKGVSFFRESLNYTILKKPILCDILTCPAPIASWDKEYYTKVVEQRIRCMLSVMASNKVSTIILGAWGCGAFGGDAKLMGYLFAKVIREFKCFDYIVFSIKSTRLDANGNNNFVLFRDAFESYRG